MSPRERLLSAANKLFYEEGIHTVGIDRIIAKAGVAKASLYTTFGSKDALVKEYLAQRFARRRERIETELEKHKKPRDKLLALFKLQGELIIENQYRGCAFMRASAEGPLDKSVKGVCDDFRGWLRGIFREIAFWGGVKEPDRLAQQLQFLYDGATVASQMDHDEQAAAAAHDTAAVLFDAAPRTKS
jgi:AcrR family transcriptional regulator